MSIMSDRPGSPSFPNSPSAPGDPRSLDRQALLALIEASHAIVSSLDLDAVLTDITQQAAHVLRAQGASVLLLDSKRNELVFHTVIGPGGEQLVGERFDAALGIAGQALKQRRAMRISNVRQNRHFYQGIDAKSGLRTDALLVAPLIHRDRTLGVVEVINAIDRQDFSNQDQELLEAFANLAAAALSHAQAFDRVNRLNRGLREAQPRATAVGHSRAFREVLELCEKVAASKATVMILGETGTGKELTARAIHERSDRRGRAFIAVNCAALPENLLESELFGHEKGAFTGAEQQRPGRFELADGGTLFLDEVGELATNVQAKLLRVLQDGEVERIGGTRTLSFDVRVIAATNRDLRREVEAGRFRDDLYYRLNVFPIRLPSVRERREDIPLLVQHFLESVARSLGVPTTGVDEQAMALLQTYDWPGNVREIRNVIERCALLAAGGVITPQHLPPEIRTPGQGGTQVEAPSVSLPQQEAATIRRTLERTNWNQTRAARALGITRDQLRYRLEKYEIKKGATDLHSPTRR